MRVAWNDTECAENFKLCKQEAMSSFGNDEMLVEKVDQRKKKEKKKMETNSEETYLVCGQSASH